MKLLLQLLWAVAFIPLNVAAQPEEDYDFFIEIGTTHLKKAEGVIRNDLFNLPPTESEAKKHFQEAENAFLKAYALFPYENKAIIKLAQLKERKKDYRAALPYWERLTQQNPQNADYWAALGECFLKINDKMAAFQSFEKAYLINPKNTKVLKNLSDYWLLLNDWNLAEEYQKKQTFYEWLPPFCSISFKPKYYEWAELLMQSEKNSPYRNARRELIDYLKERPHPQSSDLLVATLWYGDDDAATNQSIVENLGSRGTYSAYLLTQTALNTQHVDLVRLCVAELVKNKHQGTVDVLITLMPLFRQSCGTLNIARFMSELQNSRAIIALKIDIENNLKNNDKECAAATQEALLALSAFPEAAVCQFLNDIANQSTDFAPYCFAALYQINKSNTYLKRLEESLQNGFKSEVLARFIQENKFTNAEKLVKGLLN